VRRLDVELLAVLLEDVDAAVVADRVGEPRADDVRERAGGDDGEQRVLPARDVEAGEQERRLRRNRDARALGVSDVMRCFARGGAPVFGRSIFRIMIA
jgi:hypothetical protein